MSDSFEHGVLTLLSEAWQTERAEADWLKGVVEAADPLLKPDLGIVAVLAKAGRASAADLSVVPYGRGLPSDLFSVIGKVITFSRSTSDMRRNFACRGPVMTFSEFSCYSELAELLAPVGIRDVAVLFTGPVFGCSLAVAANYRDRHYFTPHHRATLSAAVSQLSIAFNAQRFAHGAEGAASELSKVLVPEQASVELRCAELLALGLDTKEIAVALDISPDAVRKHISNGMKRHGVQTREQLVERVLGAGLRLAG